MAITKRSDNDGWKRGAKGIDGSKDDHITRSWMNTEAVACMYTLTDDVVDYESEPINTKYSREGASGSELRLRVSTKHSLRVTSRSMSLYRSLPRCSNLSNAFRRASRRERLVRTDGHALQKTLRWSSSLSIVYGDN
jgi:hypothetical protein